MSQTVAHLVDRFTSRVPMTHATSVGGIVEGEQIALSNGMFSSLLGGAAGRLKGSREPSIS
ncbi:MAG: hypothetical protein ABI633_07590 [Burkholderiales bacterium]